MCWVIERVLYLCLMGVSTLVPFQGSFSPSKITWGCSFGVEFLVVPVFNFDVRIFSGCT